MSNYPRYSKVPPQLVMRSEISRATKDDELDRVKSELKDAKREIRHICHHFNSTIDDYLAIEGKYEKLQRHHANLQIENRLLRSEVDDLNTTINAIEDRMQDQYHESLELKMHNAELKERNAHLEKEVQRLRQEKSEDETKKSALSSTEDRATKKTPATYKPTGPLIKPIYHRYAQSTASSRAKSLSPPTESRPFHKNSSTTSRLSTATHSDTSNSAVGGADSSTTAGSNSSARTITNDHIYRKLPSRAPSAESKSSSSRSNFSASAASVAQSTKANVGHKRTLTPQLRETIRRTVERSPAPCNVWYNLPVITDETKPKRSMKGKKATVEDDEEETEVKKPAVIEKKRAGIKSTAFL